MIKKIIILVFLAILTIPVLFSTLGLKFKEGNWENRAKARMPKYSTAQLREQNSFTQNLQNVVTHYKEYIFNLERFVNDDLKLRPPLLDLQRMIYVTALGRSPAPDKVVIGEDGWLFLGEYFGDIIKESKGIKTLNEEERKLMVDNVVRSKEFLKGKGIDYFLTIAPNKHSVYGEHLPIAKVGPNILETFTKDIGKKVNFIDLKKDYDKNGPDILFDKTNTHFNGIGAFEASNTLIEEMRKKYPDIPSLIREDYTKSLYNPKTDELTRMLRVENKLDKITFMNTSGKRANTGPKQLPVPDRFPMKNFYEKRYVNEGKPYKVLMFGDSFMGQMVPFLKTQFGEVTFVGENMLNSEAVMIDKPDIVIQEIVERGMDLILLNQ